MIIDMLAHIGVKKGEDYHVESLIEIMNQSGVDKCIYVPNWRPSTTNTYMSPCRNSRRGHLGLQW